MVSFGQLTAGDYLDRGYQKINSRDYYGAVADFSKAIELDPDNASLNYDGRGLAKYLLKDYKGSINDFSKAIELDPNNFRAYGNRGNAKKSSKDYYGAINDYSKVVESDDADPKLIELTFTMRAIAKSNLGDRNGACADMRKAASLGNEDAAKMVREGCN